MRKGEELTFVAPPRYEPDAAFKHHVQIGSERSTAMQKAAQGQRGYGEASDYRGKPIIASWSYLPSYRWGMVVKQDIDEAFALVNQLWQVVAGLLGGTVLAVTAVALGLARAITRPIREAALVADRVASGDLTVTCQGQAFGEAGLLLQAIRKMIQDLRSLIGKIQRSSITLLSTATEIAATSRQQEQSVYDYSASTNQAAAAVNQISATSNELLKTMNEVNQVANQTAKVASTGQQSLAGMDQTMRQLAESTGSISSKLSVIMGHIITGAQGLHQRFDQVNEGMRVQSQGAEQIREAMSRLSEAANQTSQSIREFNKATDRLREAVGGLKDEVSGFTVNPIEPALCASLPRAAS
jgi:methyl-accepting chemotaxis protein WspA